MINLKDMKIGKKMGWGFGIILVVMAVATATSLYIISNVNDQLERVVRVNTAKITRANSAIVRVADIYYSMANIMLAPDDTTRSQQMERIKKNREVYSKDYETLEQLEINEEGKRLITKLKETTSANRDLNNRIMGAAMAGRAKDVLTEYIDKVIPSSRQIEEALKDVLRFNEERINFRHAETKKSSSVAIFVIVTLGVVQIVLAILIGVSTVRGIARPLAENARIAGIVANGELAQEVSAELQARGDEVGVLAKAMQSMIGNLRRLVVDISGGVQTVASSATELSAVSVQTAQSVQALSVKTSTVAAAAEESSANTISVATSMEQASVNLSSVAAATEEMSANTTSVAAAMEQASANLSSVASATEEMSATIGEIAANSERARSISRQAGEQAASVSALMQRLGDAAQEIGQVTETITDISSQTNLLALNATIEAARAGAAGKGFAVVANEIKELAKQTAAATEDIKTKIGGVQASAGNAITDIEKITAVVAEVGHIVASIATAIEEQAAVTRDVAGNIAQASAGVQEANERVNQTATVTRDVAGNIAQASAGVQEANERVNQTVAVAKTMAQDIAGVDAAAVEIRSGGEQVQASAAELSQLAEQLKGLIGQFKV